MPQKVVVTGASGFIAKHILAKLLAAGHEVTGTLRNPARAEEVRAALRHADAGPAALDRLHFAPLDLESDAGWAEAFAGAEALIHTASPFPLAQPADAADLIRPAVEGTLRALRAAASAGISRIILTSSVAAISGRAEADRPVLDETCWTDPDAPGTTPYAKSKTLAERAAWDFAAAHPAIRLTTINPAMVLGPPLDAHYGSSVRVIERILSGRDPMVPRVGFGVVDVRDVAEMHLRALERPATAGQRLMGVDRFLWLQEVAAVVAAHAAGRRIARRRAPDFLVRALALFDPTLRSVVPSLGHEDRFDNSRARDMLGLSFLPAEQAITETVRALLSLRAAEPRPHGRAVARRAVGGGSR